MGQLSNPNTRPAQDIEITLEDISEKLAHLDLTARVLEVIEIRLSALNSIAESLEKISERQQEISDALSVISDYARNLNERLI